jgi:phosphoheptose isomerase
VHVEPDCGNAPKKAALRDFTIAFAEHDKATVLTAVADDIEWEIVGDRQVAGIDAFGDALDGAWSASVRSLSIDTILTHGNQGSVSGSMALTGGDTLRFCDVHRFSSHGKNAKIARITSYWIR